MIGEVFQTRLHAPIIFAGDEDEGVGGLDLRRQLFERRRRRTGLIFLVHAVEHGQGDFPRVDQLGVGAARRKPRDDEIGQPDSHAVTPIGPVENEDVIRHGDLRKKARTGAMVVEKKTRQIGLGSRAGRLDMEDQEIRAALDRHWAASDAGDFEAEHDIYREDAVLEYPQSGERIRGRRNIQSSRAAQPNRKRFTVRRIVGAGDLWVTEYVLSYDGRPSFTVSIMEFSGGKVARETQYFGDPFEPGPSRAQWVERMS